MTAKPECTNENELKKNGCDHFIPVPLCFQETEYTCGVACVQSILASYGIFYKQDVLIAMLEAKPYYGTNFQNIIHFMEMLGFQVTFTMNLDIKTIKDYIDHGIPPILMIQAWKEDAIDYSYVWRDSHYVIANGYIEDQILFMDPYTLGNYTYIPNAEFMKRWHIMDQSGKHYYNCGLVIKNENLSMVYDPSNIKHQE